MSQFNNLYRLFFKKRTNISGKSLSSSQLKVRSFTVNRDILTKSSSTFQVLETPIAIESGDIVGMYDIYGTVLFLGVVDYIEDNTVEASQMLDIFDDDWLWNNPSETTLEETLKTIITNDYQNSTDELLNETFGVFDIQTTTSTNQTLESQESQYVVNFSNFLYSIYEKYSIMLNFEIPFEENTPTIQIGIPNYEKLTISNNAFVFRNFDITTNIFETNKLVVYSEDGTTLRGTFYATTSGITEDSEALNRPQKVKTNIVFSDDDLNIVKASNLRNQIYNHEITVEMIIDNQLLSIEDIHLGQEVDLFYNGTYYNTILTGYSIAMTDGIDDGIITLKFGLVRTTLTSKLFKRLGSKNGG